MMAVACLLAFIAGWYVGAALPRRRCEDVAEFGTRLGATGECVKRSGHGGWHEDELGQKWRRIGGGDV